MRIDVDATFFSLSLWHFSVFVFLRSFLINVFIYLSCCLPYMRPFNGEQTMRHTVVHRDFGKERKIGTVCERVDFAAKVDATSF